MKLFVFVSTTSLGFGESRGRVGQSTEQTGLLTASEQKQSENRHEWNLL
jgi:hypothetical protein